MDRLISLAELVQAKSLDLSRSERRVAEYFVANKHQVLALSAMELAKVTATSDATIIRTAKALGFEGMEPLRRAITDEFENYVSPASRVAKTVEETGGDLDKAFATTLSSQLKAIASLQQKVSVEDYKTFVQWISAATEVAVFGIGPSSSMAHYFRIQLQRFGLRARAIDQTGLLLADQLQSLAKGDLLVVMAYGRVYPELEVLLQHAANLGVDVVLITDTLEKPLRGRVAKVFEVPRGESDGISLHTTTLAFLENLLVGLATLRPQSTVGALDTLNALRGALAGHTMRLDTKK